METKFVADLKGEGLVPCFFFAFQTWVFR